MSTSPTGDKPGRHRRPGVPAVAAVAVIGVVAAVGVVAAIRLSHSSGSASPPAAAASARPVRPSVPSAPAASRHPSPRPSTARATTARPGGAGGFPDSGNTGVPPGTPLRNVGEMTITKAGTVVEGVRALCIVVHASNVTVRRSLVRGGSCGSDRQVEVADNVHGVLFEDVEIDGAQVHARGAGLGGSGFTCRRCDIHGMARGVQPTNNVVIEDSYIHDLYGTATSENAAYQANGSSHLVIRGSNLEMNDVPTGGMALALIGDFDVLNDILVQGNLFNGGGYAVWGGDAAADKNPAFKARDTRFIDNAFGRKFSRKCGFYGPIAGWDGKMPGNRWSGNHWLDTGRPVVA